MSEAKYDKLVEEFERLKQIHEKLLKRVVRLEIIEEIRRERFAKLGENLKKEEAERKKKEERKKKAGNTPDNSGENLVHPDCKTQ